MSIRMPIVDRRSRQTPDGPAAAVPGTATAAEISTPEAVPAEEEEMAGPGSAGAADRDEWRERFLRAAADLENLRKVVDQRVDAEVYRREKERLDRWLELGDALDRARAQAAAAPPQWRSGIEEVANLFEDLMARAGATRIDATGTFDPAVHEALCTVADPTRADGEIADVARAGWRLGERLLRPAGVLVVRNAPVPGGCEVG